MFGRSIRAIVVVGATVVACANGDGDGGDWANARPSATVEFATAGGWFEGNSILVCGHRDTPADGKYPCVSTLPTATESSASRRWQPGCSCFDADANGKLVDGATGQPPLFDNLCASDDLPSASWTFTYAIFASEGCSGEQLNDGTRNFTCYDSRDFVAKVHPNASVGALNAGKNLNEIVCVTKNASKTWQFASCADTSTADDTAGGRSRYDCGCYVTEDPVTIPGSIPALSCTCPSGPSVPPQGCHIEPPTCELLCGGTSS